MRTDEPAVISAAAMLRDITHRAPPRNAAPRSGIEASQGETVRHYEPRKHAYLEPPDADGVAAGRSTGSSVFPLSVRDLTACCPSGPIRLPCTSVVFTISGWARLCSQAGALHLQPGRILTIPAGLEYCGFPAGSVRTVTLLFHPEYLAEQMRWLSSTHPLVHQLHRSLCDQPAPQFLQLAPSIMLQLTPLLTRLAHVSTQASTDFATLSLVSAVLDAVGRLSGVSTGNVDPTAAMPRREIVMATALLRAELGRQWRIEELAREVAVSPTHLTRLFHAQIGISPAAFLRQLRADRMAELLATTSVTVGEAGAAVGWHDLAMASRSFKQRYGVSPSTYASSYRSPGPGSLADSGLIH